MKQNRYYSGRNFSVTDFVVPLSICFAEGLKGYRYKSACLAWNRGDVKTDVYLIYCWEKKETGDNMCIMFNLVTMEKVLCSEMPLNLEVTKAPWQNVVIEGQYLYCWLQGNSLVVGAIKQENICKIAEDAQKIIDAYAMCSASNYLKDYFWSKDKTEPQCLYERGNLFFQVSYKCGYKQRYLNATSFCCEV